MYVKSMKYKFHFHTFTLIPTSRLVGINHHYFQLEANFSVCTVPFMVCTVPFKEKNEKLELNYHDEFDKKYQ